MSLDNADAARLVCAAAEDKKGQHPVVLDVRGLSGVTDFYVIVSGGSPPHLKALAAEIAHRMKAAGLAKYRASGSPESGWMVVDLLGVVVHLFTAEAREYYALEDLWRDAPRLV